MKKYIVLLLAWSSLSAISENELAQLIERASNNQHSSRQAVESVLKGDQDYAAAIISIGTGQNQEVYAVGARTLFSQFLERRRMPDGTSFNPNVMRVYCRYMSDDTLHCDAGIFPLFARYVHEESAISPAQALELAELFRDGFFIDPQADQVRTLCRQVMWTGLHHQRHYAVSLLEGHMPKWQILGYFAGVEVAKTIQAAVALIRAVPAADNFITHQLALWVLDK